MDSLYRAVLALPPLIHSAVGYWKFINERLSWSREARAHVRTLGSLFWWIDTLPQRLYSAAFVVISVASLGAILGAFLVVNNVEIRYLSRSTTFLIDNVLAILVIWLFVAVIAHGNLVSRGLLWLVARVPAKRYRPDWINAAWHLEAGERAVPVGISANHRQIVPNRVVEALTHAESFSGNRAIRPSGLAPEELANVLVVGCILEGKLYDLKTSLPADYWNTFYDSLASVAQEDDHPFKAASIARFNTRQESFYNFLRERLNLHLRRVAVPTLERAPVLEHALMQAVVFLQEECKSDARTLAERWLRKTPSMARADKRARRLPRLDQDSMRAQFLKLAVAWGVWPGVDPGPFIYPFSKNLAAWLFNNSYLETIAGVKGIIFDDHLSRLISFAESEVVREANELIRTSADKSLIAWRNKISSALPGGVFWKWWLAYEVDYLMWHLARTEREGPWRIAPSGSSLVRE